MGGVRGPGARDLGSYTPPHGESFEAYRVSLIAGSHFSFWFTLSNQDRIPVTITHIGATPQPYDYFRVSSVGINSMNVTTPATVPFHPFVLHGPNRDFMNVLVTMQMRRCLSSGANTEFASIPVTFKVLGVSRHTDVYLPTTIRLVVQEGISCQG